MIPTNPTKTKIPPVMLHIGFDLIVYSYIKDITLRYDWDLRDMGD